MTLYELLPVLLRRHSFVVRLARWGKDPRILVMTDMTLVELGKGLSFLHACGLRVVHARGL